MAGANQGHEAEVPKGGGDNNDPDRPFEAPGEIPTPGIDEADWGNLADAVSAHGEIPDDLDVGDTKHQPVSAVPDGHEELMAAFRAAQSGVRGKADGSDQDVGEGDDGGATEAYLAGLPDEHPTDNPDASKDE